MKFLYSAFHGKINTKRFLLEYPREIHTCMHKKKIKNNLNYKEEVVRFDKKGQLQKYANFT